MGKKLAQAALLIAFLSLVSKFLGLAREMVLAQYYGVSISMDAYVVATLIPTVLGTIIRACIITAFIPIYNGYLAHDEKDVAKNFVDTLLTCILAACLLIVGGLHIFASQIIYVLAPGFNEQTHALTVDLLRMTMPIVLFFSLLGLVNAIQQAQNMFLYPALIGLPANLVIIGAVVLFADSFGIKAAAAGSVFAVLIQVIIQWPGLRKCGYSPALAFDYRHPGVKKMLFLIGPIILSTAATQVNLFVDRYLASSLPSGSISALNYANKINMVFISLFVMSIVTVMFPNLAKHAARNEHEAFTASLSIALRIIIFVTVPIMFVLVVFNHSIVEILLQRGAFDGSATEATAIALFFFSFGMLGMALLDMLNRAFYAYQETRVPVLVNLGVVGLNIFLNIILVRHLAHGGLALGTSIAVTMGVVVLFYLLRKKFDGNFGRDVIATLGKTAIAAIIAVCIAKALIHIITFFFAGYGTQQYKLMQTLILAGSLTLGGSCYIFMTITLGCDEPRMAWDMLAKKISILDKLRNFLQKKGEVQ